MEAQVGPIPTFLWANGLLTWPQYASVNQTAELVARNVSTRVPNTMVAAANSFYSMSELYYGADFTQMVNMYNVWSDSSADSAARVSSQAFETFFNRSATNAAGARCHP